VTACMRLGAVSALLFGVALFAAPAAADSIEDEQVQALEDENALLRRRLEALEGRLARLEDHEGVDVAAAPDEKPFEFVLSGFLKTDMLWNDSRLNSTSAPRFARAIGDSDGQFTSTVQHSRFILDLLGPSIGEGRLKGYLEMDFFNFLGDNDLNFSNAEPRVRQLYVAFDHPTWRVVLGETWDLFAPLNTATLNTNGNYWFGGNAGFRRPQLQARKRFSLGGEHDLTLAGSVNANIGVGTTDEGGLVETGRDSMIPVFQGSVVYHVPGLFVGEGQIGVSGLWGREQFDTLDENVDQWGVGGHLVLPITDWATFKGEIHYGENLDAFLAGPGVNPITGDAIRSASGWAQLGLQPFDSTRANLIFGMFDPVDSDLVNDPAVPAVARNIVWSVNLERTLYEHFVMGVEFQRFDTKYRNSSNSDANLVWLSGILNF